MSTYEQLNIKSLNPKKIDQTQIKLKTPKQNKSMRLSKSTNMLQYTVWKNIKIRNRPNPYICPKPETEIS